MLSLDCRGKTAHILGTKSSCSHASVEVCALKSVLKMMRSDKVLAWFGVLQLKTVSLLFSATFGIEGAQWRHNPIE